MRKIVISVLAIGCSIRLIGQPVLTLEEAVTAALANNPDIEIERIDAKTAHNNVHRGNAGQLPTVDVQGSYDYNHYLEQRTELGDFALPGTGGVSDDPDNPGAEEPSTTSGLGGSNISAQMAGASLTASYVLFNGFRGRYRYQQLQTQDSLARHQLKATMEDVFVQVLNAYLEVAQYQSQLSVYEEAIALSQARLERNRIANEYGGANQLQTLQAEVDLNNDSVAYQDNQLAYQQAQQQLALLIEWPANREFRVEEDIAMLDEPLEYEALQTSLRRTNTNLQIAEYNLQILEKNQALEDAARFPTLSAIAGFNYNYQTAEQSITELQESYGPVVGLRLNYSLYDGGQRKIRRQNAQLAVEQQEAQWDRTQRQLTTELLSSYQNYENYRRQLATEQRNLNTYERNLQKSESNYELGLTSGTELRDAQLNLTNARQRIIALTYQVKRAETQLVRLSGGLTFTSNESLNPTNDENN